MSSRDERRLPPPFLNPWISKSILDQKHPARGMFLILEIIMVMALPASPLVEIRWVFRLRLEQAQPVFP